jgi:uncharacterized protein
MPSARITSFLVKIASRCNLDCDYCYVYHHADQSWRAMPRILSEERRRMFAARLAEHVRQAGIDRVAVILHGGEPLLAGHSAIVDFAELIRSTVGAAAVVDVGLQTNGLLLTDEVLDAFEAARIAVSLSMDGPREAHDLHRRSRRGRSSFDKVEAALERLKLRPSVFAGVIAVIDPATPPETLLSFFAAHRVPKLDFLLPDSNHDRPPPGRAGDPELYERWLIEAFDAWFDHHPELQLRTFEALLDAASGLPSGTDAFGLGDVSLLSVETDGTWHDLDVLKVAADGATRLVGSVSDTSVEQVASSARIAAHRRLLSRSGLSDACRACAVVETCGGGSVPHRFGGGSFDHPTVYCGEMKALIAHVQMRLLGSLIPLPASDDEPPPVDLDEFELAETSGDIVTALHRDALAEELAGYRTALIGIGRNPDADEPHDLAHVARRAGTIAWQRARRSVAEGRAVRDVDGNAIEVTSEYADQAISIARVHGAALEIGLEDAWLRAPFGDAIVFEDAATTAIGRFLVKEALRIIAGWRPALAHELRTICSAVQFVRDPSAHPDKIVSFSDDSVPGALYVSIGQGDAIIDAYDLADSLVHEYRHQKLYLLERRHPTTRPGALVVSPWREDPRPASGLLHAAFVFVELRRFWEYVRDRGPARLHNRAMAQLDDTERNLAAAFATLRGCDLTPTGRALSEVLESRRRFMPLAA